MPVIEAADLFCGAGGTSSGLMKACDALGLKVRLTAVNHWPRAVETHRLNHAGHNHLCASLASIEPRKAVPNGKLRLLLASPECTHHSIARGGKPVNDQSRASAWHVLHWVEELRIADVVIENVKEFQDWAPIGSNGRPLKSRKGELFRAFIDALKVTYKHVEYRVLNSADYGAATARRRLFIRCSHHPIRWPIPTHAQNDPKLPAWRGAREIIDWSIPGTSIFNRKRPLKASTLARLAAGIPKFWGKWAEPFLVILRNNQTAQSLDKPLPTMTTSGANFGLCEPFVMPLNHGGKDFRAHSIDKPMPTVTSVDAWGVAVPFIVPTNYGEREGQAPRTHDIGKPFPTVVGTAAHGVVEPFIVGAGGPVYSGKPKSVNDPLGTVMCDSRRAVVEPLIMSAGGPKVDAFPVTQPMNTVLTRDHMAAVEPFILPQFSGAKGRGVSMPVPAITTTSRGIAIIAPFIIEYYGTGGPRSVEVPLQTVTSRDRFGLVTPVIVRVNDPTAIAPFLVFVFGEWFWLDIRFRMLQPHELAAAMGFSKDYIFTGTREERVKQSGNAVEVNMAAALCQSVLSA